MVEAKNRDVGRLGKPRHLVLGMDPGAASCGFALLDTENHEILVMGTRLFKEPIDSKTKQSLAAVRRGFRSARRNIDRTQDRLKHCLACFKTYGLVPDDATKEYFHTVKGDNPPLMLRKEGLERLLTNREWAMVLYSLCKRRGYIPHGESAKDKSNDSRKVLSAIAANRAKLEAEGYETVGAWLASRPYSRNTTDRYDNCVAHEMLVEEARILFARQRSYGATCASSEFEERYIEIFNWQRSRDEFDARVYGLVGSCVYFPEEKRAARCSLTSELVSAYGALGNIVIMQEDGNTRRLTSVERDACMKKLFAANGGSCMLKFGALRKMLDLGAREYFKGVAADEEKNRQVFEPKGWRALCATLGKDGVALLKKLRADRDLADAVMEAAAYATSSDSLQKRLELLDLSEGEVEALLELPYASKPLNGYGNRSKKALDILLGCFEDSGVLSLSDAEAASGLGAMRITGAQLERSDRLMPYEEWMEQTGRANNNPVVLRAMAQMRKVVNAVCREWGVPNEIRVELDKELRLPKKARDAIIKSDKRNEKERKRVAGQIADLLLCSPDAVSGKQIEKYRLWEEQGNHDLYTNTPIREDRLVNDDTYTQIDHILPFSRTGDNSRHNKVLVLAESNQLKREMTPYEWMTSGKPGVPSWDDFKRRIEENRKISHRKKEFLLEQDLDARSAEFLQRNITDTAYMSREVCAYLSDCLLFPDDGKKVHVVPTMGRATAWLRRRWGLNLGVTGEKDREDDRHHAVDACVIAACSRSLIAKTSKVMEKTHWSVTRTMTPDERRAMRMDALRETMPWESFADDVRATWKSVVPTRYVPRRAGGELFEQTTYSYVGKNKEGKDLARKKGHEKDIVAGNAVVSEDGKSLRKVGRMLCLRLWYDPEIKKKGVVVGGWYADPVYKADVPALKDGSYVPRIAKSGCGRSAWTPVPNRVLETPPIEIYPGDLVEIDGVIGRFTGFHMNNANWEFEGLTIEESLSMPTIGSLTGATSPKVKRTGLI